MRYKQSSERVSVFWKLKISEKVAEITQLYPMQLGTNTEYKENNKKLQRKTKKQTQQTTTIYRKTKTYGIEGRRLSACTSIKPHEFLVP